MIDITDIMFKITKLSLIFFSAAEEMRSYFETELVRIWFSSFLK